MTFARSASVLPALPPLYNRTKFAMLLSSVSDDPDLRSHSDDDRQGPISTMSYRIHTNRLYIGPVMTSRILVVEDDKRLAATLERVLTAEGHQVELVGDGLEALRRARVQPFDPVVLDIMLPSLDGAGVSRPPPATRQGPIPLLSAPGRTDEPVLAVDDGPADHLLKHF